MKKIKYITVFTFIFCLSAFFSGCIFGKNEYTITSRTLTEGTIIANKEVAKEGEEVTLSYTANNGYVFKYYIVNGESITGNTFIMPKDDVVITAKFDTINFSITYHTDNYTNHQNTRLSYSVKSESFIIGDATKNGFVFDGWYTEESFINKITEISEGTVGNLDIYAKFNPLFNLDETKTKITSLTSYGLKNSTIEVPEKIEGTTITAFGNEAFKNSICTTLKFGKNITSFGQDVFKDCYGINNVYFNGELADWVKYNFFVNSDKKLTSHPFYLSFYPNLYLNGKKVEGNFTFPKEIKKVGANCFYKLDDIEKVNYTGTLNEWLKIEFLTEHSSPLYPIGGKTKGPQLIINEFAITGENITIPSDVSIIHPGALAYTLISSVTLPSSVKYIGSCAFYNCTWLNDINLYTSSVAVIYDKAFYGCKNLKLQNMPSTLVTLGNYAFYNCSQFSDDESNITLNNNLASIGEFAFYGCAYLKGVTLGSGIDEIKASTFENSGLVQITLPINISKIGHAAFRNCSNLTTIYVKKLSDTKIISGADDMFRDTALEKIYFEDSVQMNLYKTKVYWNLYTDKFSLAN